MDAEKRALCDRAAVEIMGWTRWHDGAWRTGEQLPDHGGPRIVSSDGNPVDDPTASDSILTRMEALGFWWEERRQWRPETEDVSYFSQFTTARSEVQKVGWGKTRRLARIHAALGVLAARYSAWVDEYAEDPY